MNPDDIFFATVAGKPNPADPPIERVIVRHQPVAQHMDFGWELAELAMLAGAAILFFGALFGVISYG